MAVRDESATETCSRELQLQLLPLLRTNKHGAWEEAPLCHTNHRLRDAIENRHWLVLLLMQAGDRYLPP
jgi:hypothetical protein